ncbi:O-fucosyltransferase 16 isoform X2 [Olea europaea var. sylvestris]|uniref:O-fucosyltransferase 16 isoform X2 n=1 Tax=Olea europaea var. sylvestris TaxID=158386 RepID=UPI000C1CECF1|nr:O-fucosyltransferase 16 isoform X2 [Olea europaea var. sylvestris]
MALPRRRHQPHKRARFLIPAISAVSAVLVLLFFCFSFLVPSPTDIDHFHHRRHYSSMNDGDGDGVGVGNGVPVFRVPTSGGVYDRDIWTSKNAQFYYGCSNASSKFAKAEDVTRPNRYLAIATSGGLNQQRTGITDAVVAARILNATLIVPILDKKSFWKDNSNFSEIFNVDWFISYLAKDVEIIKVLPHRRGRVWTPYTMRVPRKCNDKCYTNRVLPVLLKKRAVMLTKFDYRLANKLEMELQKLRCRVNYHALKFTDPILELGAKLVQRMRMNTKHYIALHLRFEPDMLAFSGCYYGGGDKERRELGKIRRRWKTLHISNPDKGKRQGRCPLTPEEVGLMLRALGYGKDTHIYVASGEVYGGEETLAPLKALFPNFYSKDTISSKQELEPFSAFSSRMAALDFIVCDESDVFVTNNNGNMAKILAGRRRYFGHKPTIRPNAKKLYRLFLNRENMTWGEFASKVRTFQRGFMGEPKEVRPGRGEFHENPSSCICEDSEAKAKMDLGPLKRGKGSITTKKDTDVASEDQNMDDDLEWSDPEDYEDPSNEQVKVPYNQTSLDYDALMTEDTELDELLSD